MSASIATVIAILTSAAGQVAHVPDFSDVETVLEKAVEQKAFPGCTAAIGNADGILWQGAFGHLSQDKQQPVTLKTIYDLASLTKVVGTTSVVMQLVDSGKLSLDDPVVKWIPEFLRDQPDDEIARRKKVTLRHLLTHTSGLPPWKPYYKTAKNYKELLALVAATPLERDPGTKYSYSDLGMILMGEIAARAGGKPLPELEQELVFPPLKMTTTMRNPPKDLLPRIAPTEVVDDLGLIRGVVHDENSRAGEGNTGHAGLFSTVGDLSLFAQDLLRARLNKTSVLPAERVKQFTRQQSMPDNARRGLGWQTFTSGYSGGTLLSDNAFGHTGFTGTSIWIDPDRNLFLILLTNRVHPTRDNHQIGQVRRDFADAAVMAVIAERNE